MKYLEYKLKSSEHLVAPIGDLHFGSGGCDVELLKKQIKKIHDVDADVILMGDLIENATKVSPGDGVYQQTISPAKQIEEIINLFTPIKNNILCGVIGNHCVRARKGSGVDLMKVIMDGLDAGDKYAEYTGMVRLKNKNTKYDIYSWHGAGGGSTLQGALRPLYKQAEWIDADIYLKGHCHNLFHQTMVKREIKNNEFKDILKHYILTGSFMKWDGEYPEMQGYQPMLLGSPLIHLNGKKHEIGVDLEW